MALRGDQVVGYLVGARNPAGANMWVEAQGAVTEPRWPRYLYGLDELDVGWTRA